MQVNVKELFKEITKKEIRSSNYLEGGITNDNYLFNDSYVLRVPKPFPEKAVNYLQEKNNYKVIEPLKMSEKLLYLDEVNGFKITKFIHNTHYYGVIDNNVITQVAKLLKRLHGANIKVPYGYQAFKRLENYKENISPKYYLKPEYEEKVIKDVRKVYAKDEFCLCHNDLVKGNLLFTFNTAFIIDWENGGMNNPTFDLASFISENNLSYDQKIAFLKKYYGYKYSELKLKRVDIFIAFLDVLFYYWAMSYFKDRKEEIYLRIAQEKLERIKMNFN